MYIYIYIYIYICVCVYIIYYILNTLHKYIMYIIMFNKLFKVKFKLFKSFFE